MSVFLRRSIARLLTVSFFAFGPPAVAAPPRKKPPTRTVDDVLARTAVCEGIPLSLAPGESSVRFALNRSGVLDVAKNDTASPLSFRFPDASKGSVARLDVVSEDGKTTRGVACGEVDSEHSYTVAPTNVRGHIVIVQLFEPNAGIRSELDAEEQAVRSAAEAVERLDLHRSSTIRTLAFGAREALANPTDAAIAAADSAAKAALAPLDKLNKDLFCDAVRPKGEFGAGRCDEALTLRRTISVLRAVLAHAAAETRVDARPFVLQADKLSDIIASLDAGPEITEQARIAQCRRLRTLRWLTLDWARRPVARAFVPVIDSRDRLFVAHYGENATASGVKTQGAMGMLVTGVPRGQKTSFAVHAGKPVSVDLATLLVTFLPLAKKIGPSMLAAENGAECKEESLDPFCKQLAERRKALRIESAVCNSSVVQDPDNDQALTVDAALQPSALVESRATMFGPLTRDNLIDVVACQGETCTGADDDKAVKSRVSITPDRSGSFTLLAELSLGYPILDKDGWAHGLRTMNAPTFQAVGGPDGPDQLYEVRQSIDPRNAVTTSVLLGYRVSDRFLIASGPALLIGTSGGTFTQWNFRGGWSFTKGLALMLGPSLRLLPYLNEYQVGERASVARTPTGSSSPPSTNTHYAAELQVDIGLAIDLGTLAGSAADTIKSFGGGK